MTDRAETPDGPAGSGTPPWLEDVVQEAILLAIDRRTDDLSDRVVRIANDGGVPAMFSACWAWAIAAGHMSGLVDQVRSTGAGGLGLIPVGGPIDEADSRTFALRFLVCAVNNDMDTASALFYAPLRAGDEERNIRGVMSVLVLVGEFGRRKRAAKARVGKQQIRQSHPGPQHG